MVPVARDDETAIGSFQQFHKRLGVLQVTFDNGMTCRVTKWRFNQFFAGLTLKFIYFLIFFCEVKTASLIPWRLK